MQSNMTPGLITPLEELPLFNGELEALLNSPDAGPAPSSLPASTAELFLASPPASDTAASTSSTGDESDSSISADLQLLQQKIQDGMVGGRWKAKYQHRLTPEGEEKRRQRRERNREAASRCRDRRRERTYGLVQESEKYETGNQTLMREIQELQEQKRQLEEAMSAHQISGECLKHMPEIIIDP